MILKPANVEELQRALVDASAARSRIEQVDLSSLGRVVEYRPEDMTVTVEAGALLSDLQAHLKQSGQWLPIDPPFPEQTTIGRLLCENLSGPRRFGYGTIRDYLIGLSAVLADGRLVKGGGKVVKNVAGYDLQKLFVGSHGSLGVIVGATFKVLPLPATERILQFECKSPDHSASMIQQILSRPMTPAVLDLQNVTGVCTLVVAFAGTADEVDWQIAESKRLGISEGATLDYNRSFWAAQPLPFRRSVLPSKLSEVLKELGDVQFVARAGNGTIYYRGGTRTAPSRVPMELTKRLKATFDPNGIFPELPL